MAVKAVCIVSFLFPKSSTEFTAEVNFASLPDSPGLSGTLTVDLEPGALAVTLETAIKDAVQTYLEGQGVTFGLLDSVRLIGALL